MKDRVNILGTEYSIIRKAYDAEPSFEKMSIDGFCDGYSHEIVYCDPSTHPNWKNESEKAAPISCEKQIVRHELIHAFLNESGLMESSCVAGAWAWAKNEEMVDWIALQFPKILKAFEDVGCL